jgi:hypothetical protein
MERKPCAADLTEAQWELLQLCCPNPDAPQQKSAPISEPALVLPGLSNVGKKG